MKNVMFPQHWAIRRFLEVAAALISCAALLLTGTAAYGAGTTTRVNVDSTGIQGDDYSRLPALSADGRYVAFASEASNLVAGDTNHTSDIFVRDRETGVTTRVSVDSSGTQGMYYGLSYDPALSADGRFVAFTSLTDNFVADDTNWKLDIFVHDRETGVTTRVSESSTGDQGDSDSYGATLSADGRYVTFYSNASNLAADDTNAASDIFVHDRDTGATTRVSVSSTGTQGNRDSYNPALSADGRYVAFHSSASTLVADDTNETGDVFVHDRLTGVTTRVSVSSIGTQGNNGSNGATLSADARYVAFFSSASNLVADDKNWRSDIFIHDRETAETNRISVNPIGTEGNDSSYNPALSADGRYVAFTSAATNLAPGVTNDTDDIFLHDNQTGEVIRVSVNSDGTQAQGIGYYGSDAPALSADGHTVVFSSYASNLVADDTNGSQDIFVHEWSPTFSIIKAGTGAGLVTSIPAGVSCGSTCSAAFEKNSTIALMAVAEAGSTFTGWGGLADCADGVVTLMDDLMSCTASFVPTLTIAATDATATEAGPTAGTFTFTRTGSTTAHLTVNYTVMGTATSDSDYWPLIGRVDFQTGSSTATTEIWPTPDKSQEPKETVTLQLAPSENYVIGDTSTATVVIIDMPVVTVTAADAIATEAGRTTGRFVFTRTGSVAAALTVNFRVGGTANARQDYQSLDRRVTFPIGARTVIKTVTPSNDTVIESRETVILHLVSNAYYNVGSAHTATVNIISDEIPSVSVVAIDDTATEAGRTTGKFMITRSGPPSTALKVYFKIGGAATANTDYYSLGSSVVFPAGISTMIGTLVPIDDKLSEPREQVVLQLLPKNTDYSVRSPGGAAITIISNE